MNSLLRSIVLFFVFNTWLIGCDQSNEVVHAITAGKAQNSSLNEKAPPFRTPTIKLSGLDLVHSWSSELLKDTLIIPLE